MSPDTVRKPCSDTLGSALLSVLAKQLESLESELRLAERGDTDSVQAARVALRRIAVILEAMRGNGALERTARLRRRVVEIRRALGAARRRYAALGESLDQGATSARELEGKHTRAQAKLRRRLQGRRTRKTLASLQRLAGTPLPASPSVNSRDEVGRLVLRGHARLLAYGDMSRLKPRTLRRLRGDLGRLVHLLELFPDVLGEAGQRLRSRLAEAHGNLGTLRPSRGSLKPLTAGVASRVSFLTDPAFRRELEQAIAGR